MLTVEDLHDDVNINEVPNRTADGLYDDPSADAGPHQMAEAEASTINEHCGVHVDVEKAEHRAAMESFTHCSAFLFETNPLYTTESNADEDPLIPLSAQRPADSFHRTSPAPQTKQYNWSVPDPSSMGAPSAQSSPGTSALALHVPTRDAADEQFATKTSQEWNIDSPEVTSVTLFDEAHMQMLVDQMYFSAVDPFAALKAYLKRRRYRALDVFMEIDKDRSKHIDIHEFTRFVKRVVPNMTKEEMRNLFHHLDLNRDRKIAYKEIAEYMSIKHNIEDDVRKRTSHMRITVNHMGPQMNDLFHRLAGWQVDRWGQISHEELQQNLAVELPKCTTTHLRCLTEEVVSIVDQSGRVAVRDVIFILKAVWMHETKAN